MTEINKKLDLAAIPPTNNDGDPYILPLDIYKEGYSGYNISNWFKGRVGDNGTPFAIRWYSHGRLLNIQGMRPFIEGQVGDYTIDDSDPDNIRIDMAEDASNIHIVGDVDDTQAGGVAIYRLISQAFPKSGIFYGKIGFMGTQDDGTLVNTGVDIVFKVLAGHMNMLGARKFYVSELEKAWLDLQEKIRQYDQQYKDQNQQQAEQFKQDTENALADLNTKIANEIKRAEDTLGDTQAAIDSNLASLKLLATHIGSLEAQLKASDVVSVSDFKSKTDYLDNSINNRLKQIDTNIEAFSDLSALSAKYPNGQSGLFYAAGHLYIYNNGWVDQGAYPSAPLTENEKEILNNAIFTKAFIYDDSQIVTPYNDVDLFPTNTVITFATNMTKVLHAPVQDSGTFITIGNSTDGTFHDKPKDGTFQEFISYSGYTKRRMLWGGKWTKWLGASDDNEAFEFIYDDSQIVAPYNDANLFPTNTVITFVTAMTKVLHAPVQDSGTFITIGNSTDGTAHGTPKDGTFQEFISSSGYTKRRMFWGGKWTKWLGADGNETSKFIYDDSQIVTPYNDADLFPTNTVITFATDMTKVLNVPTQDSGTFITTGSSADGTFHGTPKDGTVQKFISYSGYAKRRMLWGGKWTKWLGTDDNETSKFIYDDSQIVAPYNDANLFPTNTSITFATAMTKVLNVPTQESGTFITIGSSADGTAHGTPKDGTFQEFISSSGSTKRRMLWGGKWTEWLGADGNETHELSPSDKEFKLAKVSLSMFGKFGVIGDSYASGVLEDYEHTQKDTFAQMTPEMTENLSWPTMLARKWGTSMLHLAKGGLSTRTWLTDDQGLKKLNESDPQDIYYLCLGINDYYGLGDSYLGIESDMESGADSFYGNYAKIIKAIKAKAPLAKIIMFGIAITSGDSHDRQQRFSDAQQKIAEHFNIPFISENDDELFSSDYYTKSMGSGHPSSYLYGAIAEAFERLIQLAVYRNRDYFYSYGWNGEL